MEKKASISMEKNVEKKHREACDSCHNRKIRCPAGSGACSNCQNSGRICTFSLRDEMGRPKNATRKRREMERTVSARRTSSPSRSPKQDQQLPLPPAPPHQTPKKSDNEFDALLNQPDTPMGDAGSGSFDIPQWQGNPLFMTDGFDMFFDSTLPTPPLYTPSLDSFPSVNPHLIPPTPALTPPQQNPHPLDSWTKNPCDDWNTPPEAITSSNIAVSPTDSLKSNDSNLLYRYLTRILFDLRLERGREWSSQGSEASRQASVFRSVSSLCDVVQSVLAFGDGLDVKPSQDHEEHNLTFMLTFTAISTVLDIYKSLSQVYTSISKRDTKCPGSISIHSYFDEFTNSQQQQGISRRLDNVVQLTIMDYHLAQLQRIFGLRPTESFQALLAGTDNGSDNIQELRRSLQSSIEKLKADL